MLKGLGSWPTRKCHTILDGGWLTGSIEGSPVVCLGHEEATTTLKRAI